MAIEDSRQLEFGRKAFRSFNHFMLLLWRLGLGPWLSLWPAVGGRIMVLLHTGRKSGLQHRTPTNYAIVDGDMYCVAGFGPGTDWYRNILAHSAVEIWLPDGWWAGVAEDVSARPDRLALLREVLRGSGVVAPLAGVNPNRMSDGALTYATADYRLIRVRRIAARTGPGGPGDLSWIWPIAAFVLLLWRGRRRR
jgi:deazaflavin-dependent oxidoreductase (nitroreductase family)